MFAPGIRKPWSVSSLVITNSTSRPCLTLILEGEKVNRSAMIEITLSGFRPSACAAAARRIAAVSNTQAQSFHQNHHPIPRFNAIRAARTTEFAFRLNT